MTTPIHGVLKRAIRVNGREYVIAISEDGLKVTLKGKRKGVESSWAALVGGEAALAVALHPSIGAFGEFMRKATTSRKRGVPRRRNMGGGPDDVDPAQSNGRARGASALAIHSEK
jgi:hypothetical protein